MNTAAKVTMAGVVAVTLLVGGAALWSHVAGKCAPSDSNAAPGFQDATLPTPSATRTQRSLVTTVEQDSDMDVASASREDDGSQSLEDTYTDSAGRQGRDAPATTQTAEVSALAPNQERTAAQQLVYDALTSILPRQDAVVQGISIASNASGGPDMDRIGPLLKEMTDLQAQMEELVPGAFLREGSEGNQGIHIDMDRIREAAGGTLPYQPAPRQVMVLIGDTAGDEDSGEGVQLRVRMK